MKEVADPKYFWVKSYPIVGDGNEAISAPGLAGSGRYYLISVIFGLNFPVLELSRENTFMGEKS